MLDISGLFQRLRVMVNVRTECRPRAGFIRGLLSLLLLIFVLTLRAQEPPFFAHHLTVNDGLSSQTGNYYIFQDGEGTVWLSSMLGMNRFDGHNIVQFHTDNSDSGPMWDNSVQSDIFEDQQKNLYFATVSGLNRYTRALGRMERLYSEVPDGLASKNLRPVYLEESSSTLFVRSDTTLLRAELADTLRFQQVVGVTAGKNLQVFPRSDSTWNMLSLSQNSLTLYHLERGTLTGQEALPIPATGVRASMFWDESTVFLSAQDGLLRVSFQTGDVSWVILPGSDQVPYIRDMIRVDDRRMLLGSHENGAFWFFPDENRPPEQLIIRTDRGLRALDDNVVRLHLDPDQNIWISTDGNGVFYFNPHKNRTILPFWPGRNLPVEKSAFAMCEDPEGNLWAILADELVVMDPAFHVDTALTNSINARFKATDPQNPWDLGFDSHGRLLVCSRKNAWFLPHPDSPFVQVKNPGNLQSQAYISCMKAPSGELWASAQGLGMARLVTSGREPVFEWVPGVPKAAQYYLLQGTSKGGLLISHLENKLIYFPDGLTLSSPDSISFRGAINSLSISPVTQQILVATEFGIFEFIEADSPALVETPWSTMTGVRSMIHDEEGNLWLGTTDGILRIDPVHDRRLRLDQTDGLASMEQELSSVVKSASGILYFGGTNGISIVNPETIQPSPVRTQTIISSMLLNDTIPQALICEELGEVSLSHAKRLIFEKDQRTLTFFFAGQEFSDPGAMTYKYVLHPYEKDTVFLGRANWARYPNLRSGTYHLKVWSANADGVWDSEPATLSFFVKPRLNERWWFWPVIFIMAIGLIAFWAMSLVKQAQNKAELARLELNIGKAENALLRQQMNPHFLKNALTVIQGRVSQDEPTRRIVENLGGLVKDIFEYSGEERIPLSGELNFLEKYLILENELRPIRITHSISITEGEEPDLLRIPPMILQPLIENSIKHGFAAGNRDGHIEIDIDVEDETMTVIIRDNGSGLHNDKPMFHNDRPSALSIMQTRLEQMQKSMKFPVSFSVRNRQDTGKTGVEAILVLPAD